MNLAHSWKEHVAQTLLGTARSPSLPPLEAPWIALDDPGASPSERLASRLAGLSVAMRAGRVANQGAQEMSPPATDARPLAGIASRSILERILEDADSKDLLGEWLDLAQSHGVRPPPDRLPDMVLEARTHPAIARRMPAAWGPLLSWYAGLDARASGLLAPSGSPLETWDQGELAHRADALRELRRADPAHARGLLLAGWKGESAEARATLLEALETALGPEDESFLETCLDDRSRTVRATAAGILPRLGSSACLARLRNRLSLSVRLEIRSGILGLGRKVQAVVELPPLQDAALERDLGIGPNPGQKPSPVPAGERARLLGLLVARSGLAPWKESPAQPAEILDAFLRTEFADTLTDNLKEAVVREQDREWSLLLVRSERHATDPGLLSRLSVPERRAHLLDLADKGSEPALARLLADTDPWDPTHTRDVSRRLWARRASYRDHWTWRHALPLANMGHVEALRGELGRWQTPDPQLEPGLSRMLSARIELRIELHQAFAKDATP